MPTFDFQCADCSKVFEFQRPFGSKDIPPCPKCSSANTQKLMSTPNIVFKGEGFYKTDNASGKPTEKKEEPAKESKDSKEAKEAKVGPEMEKKESKNISNNTKKNAEK